MRLGLIGTGKQGQRYLQERNGGRHIVVSGSRSIPLDDVDGVIIATHPAGHKALALEAIAAGKHVLIEKPLALNLADCEAIIDAAERSCVRCTVAHTHLWSDYWASYPADGMNAHIDIRYATHDRDYSVWLDWGPHAVAMAADLMPEATTEELLERIVVSRWAQRRIFVAAMLLEYRPFIYLGQSNRSPMARMVEAFMRGESYIPEFNRRVYRALFAQENHGTT